MYDAQPSSTPADPAGLVLIEGLRRRAWRLIGLWSAIIGGLTMGAVIIMPELFASLAETLQDIVARHSLSEDRKAGVRANAFTLGFYISGIVLILFDFNQAIRRHIIAPSFDRLGLFYELGWFRRLRFSSRIYDSLSLVPQHLVSHISHTVTWQGTEHRVVLSDVRIGRSRRGSKYLLLYITDPAQSLALLAPEYETIEYRLEEGVLRTDPPRDQSNSDSDALLEGLANFSARIGCRSVKLHRTGDALLASMLHEPDILAMPSLRKPNQDSVRLKEIDLDAQAIADFAATIGWMGSPGDPPKLPKPIRKSLLVAWPVTILFGLVMAAHTLVLLIKAYSALF